MINPSPSKNKQLFRYISILFLIASVIYLVYEIFCFEGYHSLLAALKENISSNFIWLVGVLMLLPFNWMIETLKWKRVCRRLEELKLGTAYKAVLAGASSGFITPNRIGDIIGRMNFLQSENRKSAVSLAAINSLTQNIAILLPGIPLAILFFRQKHNEIQPTIYIIWIITALVTFSILLIYLPRLARSINNQTLQPYFSGLTNYERKDIAIITVWSLVRFMVFSLQLYLLLGFFGVELSAIQALTSIPVIYLLVTFTPSFAFSEALIRGSWAVFVIGQFAADTPSILMASVGLWFINVIIPVIIGNGIIVIKRL